MSVDFNKAVNRFTHYISFNTMSDERNDTCPSTPEQLVLAKEITNELRKIGLKEVTCDKHGYIMATLPANGYPKADVVGFIAHMDTSPDMSGGPVKYRIVKNYDGKDIVLNKKQNIILSTTAFPEIKAYKGQEIMVTDGTTLLGADDKAGVCAIISAMEYLLAHPEIKHGKIRIGFTPDEEIGRGANLFDVKAFHADFAYTVDGDEIGGFEYENFNAASVNVLIHGCNVHPGSAKGKMLNSLKVAAQWQTMLPEGECPECTEGHEGFFHVCEINGSEEKTEIQMLIRDHDKKRFQKRKKVLEQMASYLNNRYGKGTIDLTIVDRYFNMKETFNGKTYILDIAQKAMEKVGIVPICKPIRGGTDGARLSFMGLPCPNLFTGGQNFHGKFEYLPLRSMVKAADTVVAICELVGKK